MNLRPLLCSIVFLTVGKMAGAAEVFAELKSARIAEIETMLPAQPAGFGRPITDREFWNSPATRCVGSNFLSDATALLGKDFPAWNDELYLEFSTIGRRPPGEKMQRARSDWLCPIVIAECAENQSRFLPLINRVLRGYAQEPTWTLAAHDGNLDNFRRKKYSVDLRSSAFAADLAQALYLLGNKIDPAVRRQVEVAIEERIFAPFRKTLETGVGHHWLGSVERPVQNNWNAVCLAGVVGAARILLPDRRERAVFVAAGEHYSTYFINGFGADGYCEEGAGYWAYGFGNFVLLRETLVNATSGRIELFANQKIRDIAAYGTRIQMTGGLAPPFADCRFGTKVDAALVAYCNRTLQLREAAGAAPKMFGQKNLAALFMGETIYTGRGVDKKVSTNSPELRSFFDVAGVLVCRPAQGIGSRLSAAIKAGGNGSHSHNDIGSFVIALGDTELAGDPGGPHAYDNKTFGPERYTYKILNSFGHPVPVVAGKLQRDATKVHPKVLKTNFTPEQDEIEIDLQSAYDVPELKTLVRTMTFSRSGAGEVKIRDTVSFSTPQTFEVAIQTLGNFRRVDERTIEIEIAGKKLRAEVQTPDGFKLTEERMEELGAPAFTRLGFKLVKPVVIADVSITFRSP